MRKQTRSRNLASKQLSAKYSGRSGLWSPPIKNGTLEVLVQIKDARNMFGRLEYLVTCVGGEGEAWVQNVLVLRTSIS
jgi:hypothetical protein